MRITEKKISLETAKLLGVPFTWGTWHHAYKYVHGEEGPELWVFRFRKWELAVNARNLEIFERADWTFYLVELDEQEATDAGHR